MSVPSKSRQALNIRAFQHQKPYYREEQDKNEECWTIFEGQSRDKHCYYHHMKGKVPEEAATSSGV